MLKSLLETALAIIGVALAAGWVFILLVMSAEVSVATAVQFALGLIAVAALGWATFILLRTALARLRQHLRPTAG